MSTTPVGDWIRKRWPDNPGATHYLGPGDDPGCCAGGHARCTYEAGWREALLSLAAAFDLEAAGARAEMDAHATRGDDDAEHMAYGARSAWRDAAREARLRAQQASSETGTTGPVSRGGGSSSVDLSALDEAASWLRDIIDGAQVVVGLKDRLTAAGECLERAGRDAVAAERARLYAELGNDHFVIFTEDGWTTEHSIECRLSGRMSECAWHEAVKRITAAWTPDMLGRWRITGISEGLPDLEWAGG